MGRMLILGGLVAGLVGLAGNGQTPSTAVASSAVETSSTQPEDTNEPCNVELGEAVVTATILPEGGRCGFKIHPKAICTRSEGTVNWLVDARTYPSDCPKLSKFELKDFIRLKGGMAAEPFGDAKCKEVKKIDEIDADADKGQVSKSGQKMFLTRCVIKKHAKNEDYEYKVVPIDEKGDELPVVDPEIRVRG